MTQLEPDLKSERQKWEEELIQEGVAIIDSLGNFALILDRNPDWHDDWQPSWHTSGMQNSYYVLGRSGGRKVEVAKYLPLKMYQYEKREFAKKKDWERYIEMVEEEV